MPKKKLVLVDGSYYMFRAYHSMPDLHNSKGEPTGTIYGTINMLRKLRSDYRPDFFAVVFDAKGKNFRHDLYPDYKANRPPIPDDLICQIAPIHEIIRALGLPLLIVDGVEADDVIGTLATQANKLELETFISSGDKDLAQLVNHKARLVNTMSGVTLGPDGVKQKYGVPAKLIGDYLALIGDSVDNVPGIPKVGPKTAVKWLNEYHSLQNIIDHANDISGKVGENLRANIDQLRLSRELVSLKLDLPLELTPYDLVPTEPDNQALRRAYSRWQFNSWLSEMNMAKLTIEAVETIQPEITQAAPNYSTILTEGEFQALLEKLEKTELFAWAALAEMPADYMRSKIAGLAFSIEPGAAVYLPLNHDYPGAPQQLPRDSVLSQLQTLIEDTDKKKLGHNLKYACHLLANHELNWSGLADDLMLQSYVLDSKNRHDDLGALAQKYLKHQAISYEDVAGKGAKQIPFSQVVLAEATVYATEKATLVLRLHRIFQAMLAKNQALQHLYQETEVPLMPILFRMERYGVMIDADLLRCQSQELARQTSLIEQKAQTLAKQTFNLSSTKQIQKILYEDIQLPVLAKTPKGQPSTSESVLQELAAQHDLPRLVLDYRSLSKLKSTYTDRLPVQTDPENGRVHTSYHQAIATTGRLSSSDPNLQNIPIRTTEGRRIRQAFIAPPGWVLLAADYSQIELRIMAHLSQDQGLLNAFNHDEDIHAKTAAEIFGTETVSRTQRRAAKAINFGLIYGMSPYGLAKQLNITWAEAKHYVDNYFRHYPGVKAYMGKTRELAKAQGYIETLFGRRVYLPEIRARNAARRQYAERTAINAPMQGTAADIIKRAMIDIDIWLNQAHTEVKLIMQVHDELVFEAPKSEAEVLSPEIKRIMAGAAELSVPLVVDIGYGDNWDLAH